MNNPEQPREIIIIKRGGDGEEGHHGGAWKIAFADFMTAMMALFLVLWLINAANEDTKRAVASYFNPVKLVERNRSEKGLSEPESESEPQEEIYEIAPDGNGGGALDKSEGPSENEYFSEPYAVLDDIASTAADSKLTESFHEGVVAMSSSSGNPEFPDPFTPNFWMQEVNSAPGLRDEGETGTDATEASSTDENVEDTPEALRARKLLEGDQQATEMAAVPAESVSEAEQAEIRPAETAAAMEAAEQAAPEPAVDAAPSAEEPSDEAVAAAEQVRAQIQQQLKETFGEDANFSQEVSVTAQDDQIMISLTDNLDISMFGLGSAVPSRDLVVALEKIGGVLSEQGGRIRIRGHTDARPFRSKDYDNWRLSSARAQSAYYMLVRGGLEENRVEEISGFADRQLLLSDDPLSPKNRRIEVLVEVGA